MALSLSEIVTYSFVTYILFYSIGKVAGFYSVSSDSYMPYFMFYIFIMLSIIIVKK
jgi:hypothetical protein